MLKKQKYLLSSFSSEDFPPFPCPQCGASLHPEKDSLQVRESAESWHYREVGSIGPDEGGGVFTAMLSCSSANCSESVAVAGRCHPGINERRDGSEFIDQYLDPLYFTPTVNLFDIPDGVPDKVRSSLITAFGLFWSDPASAGNALRTSIEGLMDYRGIKKWTKRPNKPDISISLHDRIIEFSAYEKDLGELLLATKWIGNAGSHSQELDKKKMIEGFQLIQHVLEELFHKRSETLFKTAKRINKAKKP